MCAVAKHKSANTKKNPRKSKDLEGCKLLIFLYFWLRGQDLFKTLRLVFGYEFIAKVKFEAMFLRL